MNEEPVNVTGTSIDVKHIWARAGISMTELAALEAEVEALRPWKEALLDWATVEWTLAEGNADDPRKLIADTVRQILHEHEDPLISQHGAEVEALRVKAELANRLRELVRELVRDGTGLTEDDEILLDDFDAAQKAEK